MSSGITSGARWLRSDLHVHTPFDRTKRFGADIQGVLSRKGAGDSGPLEELARSFFEACRTADLNLVAVTDHNSVEGYREISPYLETWRSATNHELTMLPGVELTVGGERNLHVLLIGAAETPTKALEDFIVALLGGRERFNNRGEPYSCERSLVDFLKCTRDYFDESRRPYLLIPAHINRGSGIDGELRSAKPSTWDSELNGVLRERAFAHRQWSGFQVRGQPAAIPEWPNLLYAWAAAFFYDQPFETLGDRQQELIRRREHWPVIEASDPNCMGKIGECHTWLKMEIADVEGIRLALLDPESRLRSMEQGKPLDTYPVITRVSVRRTDFIEDMEVPLSPSLNTLIGGRGSGKSTLIECIRYALDRARPVDFEEDEKEIRNLVGGFLKKKPSRDYGETEGMLLPDHEVAVDFQVAGHWYRITRSQNGARLVRDADVPENAVIDLDVRTLIAPRILSQRQIARIARDPAAQRRELDALAGAEHLSLFRERQSGLIGAIEALQLQRRNLQDRLALLPSRRTELLKAKDNIALLESGASKGVLARYEAVEDERRWLQSVLRALGQLAETLENAAAEAEAAAQHMPQPPRSPTAQWINDVAAKLASRTDKATASLKRQASSLRSLARQIEKDKVSHWLPSHSAAKAQYTTLQEQMKQRGTSFSEHERLVQHRADLSSEIRELSGARRELRAVEQDIKKTCSDLIDLHLERFQRRATLAKSFEASDADIRIEVVPFGDRNALSQCRERWFGGTGLQERDWEVLVHHLYSDGQSVPQRLSALVDAMRADIKATMREAAPLEPSASKVALLIGARSQELTGHFYNALLRGERIDVDAMERFVPDDWVLARVRDPQGTFKPIEQGSFGSKSTAIISILLAAGDQPLIIDQPEDDLDNQYVYNVVVSLLRKSKFARQIVIATHNANIPVNGDAELIAALDVEGRLGVVKMTGSIDRPDVKEAVSMIMEGSPEAFRLRHERYGY
jgi:ABC-type cobalamin/Fe3+-siderophores transport system ATPase subunit